MVKNEYRILYGRPNMTGRYSDRDSLETDLNKLAEEGYEILSTHYSVSGGLFGGAPTATIIMRKAKKE